MYIHRTNPGVLLLRKSFRERGKIRKVTLANLSKWSDYELSRLRFALGMKRKQRGTQWEAAIDRHIFEIVISQGAAPWKVLCAFYLQGAGKG